MCSSFMKGPDWPATCVRLGFESEPSGAMETSDFQRPTSDCSHGRGNECRTKRFTEWRPRSVVWQFGSHRRAAIGELVVRQSPPQRSVQLGARKANSYQ